MDLARQCGHSPFLHVQSRAWKTPAGWRTGRCEQVALAAGAAAVGRIARGGKEDGAGLAHTNSFYVYCFGPVNIVFMRT
jgi:hypothetical protein